MLDESLGGRLYQTDGVGWGWEEWAGGGGSGGGGGKVGVFF